MKKKLIAVTVQMERDRHAELVKAAKSAGMSQAAFLRNLAFEKFDAEKEKQA